MALDSLGLPSCTALWFLSQNFPLFWSEWIIFGSRSYVFHRVSGYSKLVFMVVVWVSPIWVSVLVFLLRFRVCPILFESKLYFGSLGPIALIEDEVYWFPAVFFGIWVLIGEQTWRFWVHLASDLMVYRGRWLVVSGICYFESRLWDFGFRSWAQIPPTGRSW